VDVQGGADFLQDFGGKRRRGSGDRGGDERHGMQRDGDEHLSCVRSHGQSAWMFSSLMSAPHTRASCSPRCWMPAGVPGIGARNCSFSLALIAGSARKSFTACASFCTTFGSIFAGPTSAYQPGNGGTLGARSLSSGTFGIDGERFSPDCAIATIL